MVVAAAALGPCTCRRCSSMTRLLLVRLLLLRAAVAPRTAASGAIVARLRQALCRGGGKRVGDMRKEDKRHKTQPGIDSTSHPNEMPHNRTKPKSNKATKKVTMHQNNNRLVASRCFYVT